MEDFPRPLVSVIIVHVRGFAPLNDALKSVFDSDYNNQEVIIVDNGCTDGSVEAAEKAFGSRLKVMKTFENIGFVRACNHALRRISAKYAVLLNDDTVVDRQWLTELVDVAESDASIGACQPKLRWQPHPDFFEYNGANGGMLDLCGVPFTRGRLFDKTEEDFGQYDKKVEVFWASGAAMFLRLSAVQEVRYLDDRFHFQMEEIDLSWRLRMRGYRVVSVPSSIVYHFGGSTPTPRTSFLKHRNNLLAMMKNYSLTSLILYFPTRVLMDLMSLAYLAGKGNRRFVSDTLSSYFWIISHPGEVLKSRRASQTIRRVPDKIVRSAMAKPSIAIQYYLFHRHSFSELAGLPLPREAYVEKTAFSSGRTGKTLEVGSVF